MTIAWQRFGQWRRGRPFWGGVLTILAGIELVGSMNLELAGGTISIGEQGFPAYLVAFTLIITGPLAWYTPAQRQFYGLIATFVSVYSLIGINLGGYFIGMLLGAIGGGLIFAWRADPPPSEEDESSPARHAALGVVILALCLTVTTGLAAPGQAMAAGPCPPAASPSPSPSRPPGVFDNLIDFLEWLLRGGKPAPAPTPSPCLPASPSPAPTGSPTVPPSGSPSPTTSASPSPGPATPPVRTVNEFFVAKRPARMTGSTVTMFDLNFDGVFDLRTVDGSIRVLRFSMAQSDTNDFTLRVHGDRGATELKSSKLTVKGSTVYFYTSRFEANLLGLIPVVYTPESLPPPIPLPFVFFTDPDVQLVLVDSPVLEAPNLRINTV